MSDRAPLNRLSAETRAKLRSTQILTSLPQVVSELLQNSIDSGASQIDIGVDCEDWSCWVRDNGSGFSKDGLAQIAKASEDGRYVSSKASTPASLESVSTLGFRGEALSSVSELCCLEIASRTARSRESWSIILKGGQVLYAGPSIRWRRESAGTVVSVRDAFFNLPIRRLSHPSSSKTIETIRQEIESYALVFPGISFSLEDASKHEGNSKQSYILKIPKTRSTLAAFRHLYGRALTEEKIDSVSGEVRIDGFVSLVGAHTKAYQFLYINKHPVSYCDLHKLIDLRFSSSSFAKHAYDEEGETSLRPGVRRPPRKGVKRPIYVLNLTIPTRNIDNCLEPAKTAVLIDNKDVVTAFLSSLIQSFLVRHGFAPGVGEDSTNEDPRKKRKLAKTSLITEPSTFGDVPPQTEPSKRGRSASSALFIRPEDISAEVNWEDPSTGQTFVINQRTGNSYPRLRGAGNVEPIGVTSNGLLRGNATFRQGENTDETDGVPGWLQEALESADDRSYLDHFHSCHSQPDKPSQYLRPTIPNSAMSHIRFRKEDLQTACAISQVDRKFVACLIGVDHRSTVTEGNEALREGAGRHIDGKILVLIDQHAADERVRVERFLKTICNGFLCHHDGHGGVEMMQLSPPVPVLLTRREASRLSQVPAYQKAFESWGFLFGGLKSVAITDDADLGAHEDTAYTQILVTAIPEVVSDKLLSGSELRELIKGYLGALENELDNFDIPSQSNPGGHEMETRWVKALRWCPRVLLDLINSKACRGAIMFNDPLSLEQCQRLIKQLSATAFPFQCAHGRCVNLH
ncbi:hypothetical protein SCLCIDRAFT_104473 [Scleroderma citrinum Foug A]|uniref:MutL C-terminal dimerisation domain-containing protein n=1 Tax=Scleroderma citrinum Foug A TaxID=1036808 RepID=A0A0C3EM00_9AGAM|nr:hypothetical protein SCLCIDRAFT_104473 [Scleroderma citrinum Foug A]